jgi:hypothetical protein
MKESATRDRVKESRWRSLNFLSRQALALLLFSGGQSEQVRKKAGHRAT